MFQIERRGKTSGRWPRYTLIVNGVELGEVRRTIAGGGDNMQKEIRRDGWHISGMVASTQASAEAELIRRAINNGRLAN